MQIDHVDKMMTFAAVVDAGSFTAAAKRLGLTRSAVSRQVAQLEDVLGAQLLNRTTRRMSLTEAGSVYHESAQRVVAEVTRADHRVRRLSEQPIGTLRVDGPVIGSRLLVPLLAEFMGRYTEVEIDLSLENQFVDIVEERIDVALRIGWRKPERLVARKVLAVRQVICASAEYLACNGKPQVPSDLANHEWIAYSVLATPYRLTLIKGASRQTVRTRGRLKVNEGGALREALLAGLGIAQMPLFHVDAPLADGRLVSVLDDYETRVLDVYAVTPHREPLPSKVRLLIDFLAEALPARFGAWK